MDINHSVVIQGIAGSESEEDDIELSHSMAQRVVRLYFSDVQSFY